MSDARSNHEKSEDDPKAVYETANEPAELTHLTPLIRYFASLSMVKRSRTPSSDFERSLAISSTGGAATATPISRAVRQVSGLPVNPAPPPIA
jgi:hypothetical protein